MFHKRQPKYKKTNPDDPWVVKTWNTPRGRAALKLSMYGIFVFLILLLIAFKSDKSPKVYKTTYTSYKKDYSAKIAELKENNYSFKYTVTIDNKTTLFYGNKLLNLESGYKEDEVGIIKYLKENDKIYKVGLSDKEEITNLYENINVNYLNANYVLGLIKQETQDNPVYNLPTGEEIRISDDNAHITSITIKNENSLYKLEYSNIGKITKADIEK